MWNNIIGYNLLPKDAAYLAEVAASLKVKFVDTKELDKLYDALGDMPDSMLCYGISSKDKLSDSAAEALKANISAIESIASRVKLVFLSDGRGGAYSQYLNYMRRETVKNVPGLLLDKLTPALTEFFRLQRTHDRKTAEGLKGYFSADTKIQTINISKSEHRSPAVNAVESFFTKSGEDQRIATRLAQIADELLMNGVFNAPKDQTGTRFRKGLPRNSDPPFGPKERMELQIARCGSYYGLCVSDFFGSIRPEDLVRFLSPNYEEQDYKSKFTEKGAGLGLYGIFESGYSLVINCNNGKRTDVCVFFENVGSYVKFRKGFQILLAEFG